MWTTIEERLKKNRRNVVSVKERGRFVRFPKRASELARG